MVLCSLLYIGVNIIMYGIFLDGTVLGMLVMVIIQTGILNGILNYLIWGIVRTRKWRLQAAKLALLAFCNAALILIFGGYSLLAHIEAGFAMAAIFGNKLRHINGDNMYKADMHDDCFERIDVSGIHGISAYFPVDMGNKYKKLGVIDSVGKMVNGKYAGETVAVMRYKSGKTDETYICPLRQIKIDNAADEILPEFYSCEYGLR